MAGTNYLGVTGTNAEARDGLFTQNARVRLTDVTDGTSGTLLVGEMGFQLKDYLFTSGPNAGAVRGGNTSWAFGYTGYSFGGTRLKLNTLAPPTSVNDRLQAFRSDHPGGVGFVFADGSVRFVRDAIAAAAYTALGTRAGNEVVPGDAY